MGVTDGLCVESVGLRTALESWRKIEDITMIGSVTGAMVEPTARLKKQQSVTPAEITFRNSFEESLPTP